MGIDWETHLRSPMNEGVRQVVLYCIQFCLMCLLLCSHLAAADEGFRPGMYQDAAGNQYLVSGPTPSSAGRTQWTISSATPAPGVASNNFIFNAIWETGAAVGNTFLIGNNSPTSYQLGYPAGQSYGVVNGGNTWSCCSWFSGQVISLSQTGNTLTISALNSNGSVASSTPLSYFSAGDNAVSVSTTDIRQGIYKDSSGNQYLVSGPTPSSAGRTQWTISAATPAPGVASNNFIFSAIWETGAAVGNTFLIGNNNPTSYQLGYPATRLYGVINGGNTWSCCSWFSGQVISLSQTGNTLTMSALNSNGSVASSTPLSYFSAGDNAVSVSTTDIRQGIYKDSSGNQYLVSGPTPSSAGRTQWTISAATPAPGVASNNFIFSAIWETGAAVGNTFLIGNNNPTSYQLGYPATRLYGVINGGNTWSCCSWFSGQVISLSQTGNTLTMSALNSNGSVASSTPLSYFSAGDNAVSVSTTDIRQGIYKDSSGNQYLVSGPTPSSAGRTQWTISSATPAPGVASNNFIFNAIWETGAAMGNTFLIGNNNPTSYQLGYPATRLYGVINGGNTWSCCSWFSGQVISLSQTGNTLTMSALNSNGSVASSTPLSYLSTGDTTSVTGTLTPASPSCTIAASASSCTVSLTWSTTNPVATSALTSNYPSTNTTVATGNSGSVTATVPYSSRTFFLYNNAQLLATSSATSSCMSGTTWNGSTCQAPLNNAPGLIVPGDSSSPGSTLTTLTPQFSWNSVTGATGYGIYIRDMTTNTLVYPNADGITNTPLIGTSFHLSSGYLVNGHAYRWAMTSFIDSTESSQSSYLYFQTPAVSTGSSNADADCLFNWAEATYSSLFSPATTSQTATPYYYRYYSTTRTYLGTSSNDSHFYYVGVDAQYDLGLASTWYSAASCASNTILTLKWPLSTPRSNLDVSLKFGGESLITCSSDGTSKEHNGADYTATAGTTVYAAENGILKNVFDDSVDGWASRIVIEHTGPNGAKYTSVYWHVDPVTEILNMPVLGSVSKGMQIATVADLRRFQPKFNHGTHFHFGVRMGEYELASGYGALPYANHPCDGISVFPHGFIDPEDPTQIIFQ